MVDEANVRIGHCSPDAPSVDVHVDGEMAFEDVAYETVTDYADLPAGTHTVTVMAHGGTDAVIEAEIEVEANTAYTALATGMLDDVQATVMADSDGAVPSGTAHARIVHASPDAPAVDVRVKDGPTIASGVGFRSSSDYQEVDAGSYDLEVVPSGSDDVALSLPGVELEGGTALTAIAIGRVDDGSLTAVVTRDGQAPVAADD
jgi:hypothetical protein